MKPKMIKGLIINLILIAGLVVVITLNKTDLIIALGLTAANWLKWGGMAVLLLLLLIHNILWAGQLLRREKKAEQDITLTVSVDNTYDPEYLRKELKRFAMECPQLKNELAEAYAQMDSMDRKQDKIRDIFERNKEASLGEVEATMEIVEQSMFRNIVRIINRAILWDPMEAGKPGKEAVYREHRERIRYRLKQNEEMLSKCDHLLSETVGYIGEKSGNNNSSDMHLDSMMETIQSLNRMRETELGGEK